MSVAELIAVLIGELALFAAAGYLLFAVDDLAVDVVYFGRSAWRSLTVYRRYPRAFASALPDAEKAGPLAIFIPAWDESAVIGEMLRHLLRAFDHPNFRVYVGHYRNDPATGSAIATVLDDRIRPVLVDIDGPTTKADCLNHLYRALAADEAAGRARARAVVLHDAEDVVHPLELRLFDRLIGRAAVVQLPVVPLINPQSRWVAGHYADEFAEAHIKELVVREAVGAAIPLAGVGCAIDRGALDRLAMAHDGRPFASASLTEDYELGLRLGALGLKTMFVRIPAAPGSPAVVASRGHFPASFRAAVRQKARWIGGIAMSGWDSLGWHGGLGERWFRLRDRRGPLASILLICGYLAALLWSQLAFAHLLGAPLMFRSTPALAFLLKVNAALLAWRIAMRLLFTTIGYGWREGLRSIPRLVVANLIAIAAALRAIAIHRRGGSVHWDKTAHIFPTEVQAS
ncbi:glycosyl transferase family protein [Sphingomonas rhizophila]|uniref:Glycosyl transferase family protein n=1 Tax=Sphingomonas rhizophila TaxID=2071607 RepID=A0A7G9SAC4_9SPHN|nr:glycosyl transferase family protein [Sphingomonas rhizophila]QNN64799.1 glycosyl transferase family protein [Sphingomonas rhizophila]